MQQLGIDVTFNKITNQFVSLQQLEINIVWFT